MDWALVPVPLGEGGATASGLTRRVRVASLVRSWDAHHRLRLRPIGLALRALSQDERVISPVPESFTAFEVHLHW